MPSAGEARGIADTGEFEQLRGLDRAGADDHLARRHCRAPAGPLAGIRHRSRALTFEEDARGDARRFRSRRLRALAGLAQVGDRRAPAPAPMGGLLEVAHALVARHVVVGRLARCPASRHACTKPSESASRSRICAVGDAHRSAVTASRPRRRDALFSRRRKYGGTSAKPQPASPASRQASYSRRIAPHVGHAVERARAAQHLAARPVDLLAVELRPAARSRTSRRSARW